MPARRHRPRRSMLYTPATRPDRVEKALTMDDGPDMVVADLEDAVGPGDKASAREGICQAITELEPDALQAELCVRLNPSGTSWYEPDLTAVLKAKPETLVLPKVEHPEAITDLDAQVTWLEEAEELEAGSIEVIAQLETAQGIAKAIEIAETIAETDRVTGVVFGAEDYAADVGARRTSSNHEVSYARQRVVLAAAIAGVDALDQVYLDYRDPKGLAEEATAGRDLGYVGKQIIHPAQIEPVHAAFTPAKEEVAEARELLAAVEEAGIEDGGVIGFQGRMVDRPIIEQAKRTVALAEALGL